jgi:hypothetical protein
MIPTESSSKVAEEQYGTDKKRCRNGADILKSQNTRDICPLCKCSDSKSAIKARNIIIDLPWPLQ